MWEINVFGRNYLVSDRHSDVGLPLIVQVVYHRQRLFSTVLLQTAKRERRQ